MTPIDPLAPFLPGAGVRGIWYSAMTHAGVIPFLHKVAGSVETADGVVLRVAELLVLVDESFLVEVVAVEDIFLLEEDERLEEDELLEEGEARSLINLLFLK